MFTTDHPALVAVASVAVLLLACSTAQSQVARSATLKVDPHRTGAPVSPLIYGNFVEFLDNHVSGLWAQKLLNRSFEGPWGYPWRLNVLTVPLRPGVELRSIELAAERETDRFTLLAAVTIEHGEGDPTYDQMDLGSIAVFDPYVGGFAGGPDCAYERYEGLPTGTLTVEGVPFTVIDPAVNQGRSFVAVMGGIRDERLPCSRWPAAVEVPVGRAGVRAHFLGQVCRTGFPCGSAPDPVARYVLRYADGATETVELRNRVHLTDFVNAQDPPAGETELAAFVDGRGFAPGGVAPPWRAAGAQHEVDVDVAGEALNGARCQRLVIGGGGLQRGIAYDGLRLQGDYVFSAYLRAKGPSAPVRVALGEDYGYHVDAYAEHTFEGPGSQWQRFECALHVGAPPRQGSLLITSAGPVELYLDQVSLMPRATCSGWRQDVVEAVKRLKPGILRFPGGCYAETYHWQDGIGNPEQRPSRRNSYWGGFADDYRYTPVDPQRLPRNQGVEPHDAGTHEFLEFCRLTDCEPLVVVNYGGGTPEEAAAWVHYCNDPPDTEWGRRRTANGHPEPFHVTYWEIGNETWGYPDYPEGARPYCEAMKAADPRIKLLACAGNPDWDRRLLRSCGEYLSMIAPHWYTGYGADPATTDERTFYGILADRPSAIEPAIAEMRQTIAAEAPGRGILVANNEWNSSAGDWGPGRAVMGTLGNALFAAVYLNQCRRNSDLFGMCNYSNLCNAWHANSITTDDERLYISPTGYVQMLYAQHSLPLPVACDVAGDAYALPDGKPVPYVDVSVTRSEDGGELALAVVNRSFDVPTLLKVDLGDFRPERQGTLYSLSGPGPTVMNSFELPERCAPTKETVQVSGSRFQLELPACSANILRLREAEG